MHPLAVLPHLRPRFAHVLDRYGHARGPAGVSPPRPSPLVFYRDIYIHIYIYTSSCIPTLCEGCCTSIQLPLEQSCLTSPRRTCPRCLHNGQLNGDRASICFHRAFGAGGWKEAHPSGWVNQPGDYLHLLTFSARTPTRLSSG